MRVRLSAALRWLLVPVVMALAACEDQVEALHVGAKDFTENMILAEMMAAMLEQEGVPVQRTIPYGNAFLTFEALKQGRLDLVPEYNGTGLIFLGQPPIADGDVAMERVRTLFRDLSLTWRERVGFSNDYVLTVRPERAQAQGLRRISDLARLPEVRFAIDEDFAKRPLDGLGALVRRYGLRQGAVVAQKIAEAGAKDRIVQSLLENDADVAELFRTDPQIEEYGLVVLEDDLRFFPVYEPAPLVRDAALQRFPTASAALAKLEGQVTAEAMRQMNAEVELNGQTARNVALSYLFDRGLVRQDAVAATSSEALAVALDASDPLSGPAGRALRAARVAFPKRAIQVREAPQPLLEVAAGRARLGVVSADAFFRAAGDRAVPVQGAEALGVIGYKLAHIVTRQDGPASLADVRRLGVGQADTASDRTARLVQAAVGGRSEVSVLGVPAGELAPQFEALARGDVEALFIMAPAGDPALTTAMTGGGFRLLPLAAWTQGNAPLRFSFLRPAQIPAGAYPGQAAPVETVSAQMVLIGPPSDREAIGAQGPITTGTASTQPLSPATVKELNRALGTAEFVDPTLPIPAALRPELAAPQQRLQSDPWGAVVNMAVLLLVGYLFYLLIAEPRRAARATPPGQPARPS